ncbi:MAG: pyrroline-5-carboxylate reductase [Planctomycetota bacterium]|jgi:pyrroline-5-carboxylate reductase
MQLAILGAGNLGKALARGLARAGRVAPSELVLTRRHPQPVDDFEVGADNVEAVRRADAIVLAVQPQQLDGLLDEIASAVDPERHTLISVVSGASRESIHRRISKPVPIVRAMPNVAIAIGQSMTCLAGDEGLELARSLFDTVGTCVVIDEEQMVPATALCACGVAFFLRAVRAASQGGIEIGFHPEESLAMAAQTAVGAAALMLEMGRHPEREIDTVTTPRGCTIVGLNELEHRGFSSAMIKGILTAAEKAGTLYSG